MSIRRLRPTFCQSGTSSRTECGGFGMVQLMVVVLVMGSLAFAGWQALRVRTSVAGEYHALSQRDMFGLAAVEVNDFYSCVDMVGDFTPALPQTCTYQDKTHTRPEAFTMDNIRNYNRLPESAKATVEVIARKNFAICHDVPDTLSITKVLNVVDSYVYLATGCDGGYAAVLVRQGLAWQEINLGQGGLACETAEKHKIPRALVYNEAVPGSGDCYLPDGRSRGLAA